MIFKVKLIIMVDKINLEEKLALFSDYWSPRVIAEMNDYQFKLVKVKGEFVWHDHKNTDEVFIVLEGSMNIEFKEKTISLSEGEMLVVTKGVEHKPYAENECKIMIIEPKGIVNTGDSKSELSAPNDIWV